MSEENMEGEIGKHYRSTKNKVILTPIEVENGVIRARVADSNYITEGPARTWKGFLKAQSMEEISEEEYQEYLKTYREDIAELSAEYEKKRKEEDEKLKKASLPKQDGV